MAARSAKTLKFCEKFVRFLEKGPLKVKFSKFCTDSFHCDRSTLLCSNFVKFGRREIGEIVRYLPDRKKNSLASQTVDIARIAPKICQQCTQSAPDFIQIGSPLAEL